MFCMLVCICVHSYYRPFGEMLCDMEEAGIYVRGDYLPTLEVKAEADVTASEQRFRAWAIKQQPNARYMNMASAVQKQHFFFAPQGQARMFKAPNEEGFIEEGQSKPKKNIDFALYGLGIPMDKKTKKGAASVSLVSSNAVVRLLLLQNEHALQLF